VKQSEKHDWSPNSVAIHSFYLTILKDIPPNALKSTRKALPTNELQKKLKSKKPRNNGIYSDFPVPTASFPTRPYQENGKPIPHASRKREDPGKAKLLLLTIEVLDRITATHSPELSE
jgi:hypothetical protein